MMLRFKGFVYGLKKKAPGKAPFFVIVMICDYLL